MLRLIAYTFELAGFINLASRSLTMYTRATVLENLPPVYSECYEEAILGFIDQCITEENEAEVRARFRIDRKSTRLNSSHITRSRMPSSA